MIPINNSDTAWLIVTDFNQENNLPYEELKEDIYNPAINQWHYENNGGGIGYVGVGTVGGGTVGGGSSYSGIGSGGIGGGGIGDYVGGNI